MSTNPLSLVLRSIRQRLGLDATGTSADALLLERVVLAGDESAFAALVERHGAMVWGVCRRVAGDAHVAEDAFQATWIVLWRKARAVKDGGSLPGWLHRVAYRLSLAARARPAAPLGDAPVEAPGPDDEAAQREVRRVIDEEVSRLPEKYRLPVVLCFLEGRTHAEAAAELGWPVGTVAGRMARAKELLHARLTRRGLAPSALPLPLAVGGAFPPVAGKAAGAGAVSLAAALLAGEAQRQWLVGAALLLLSCVGVAAGVVAYRATSPSGPGGQNPKGAESGRAPPGISPAAQIPRRRIQVDGAVALSPDGKWMAGSRGGRVRLFDVRTNEEVRTLAGEVQGGAVSLLFSLDGKWLAASGGTPLPRDRNVFQGWVKVWNLASGEGKTLTELPLKVILTPAHVNLPTIIEDYPALVGFVSGKNQLVSAVRNEVQLWDIPTGKPVRSFPGGSGSLSPDGKTLATWDWKTNATRLWELSSEKVITLKFDEKRDPVPRFLREETPPFDSVGIPAFHPDSDTVATVGAGILRLWDRKTGRFQAALDPYVAVDKTEWNQVLPNVTNIARYAQNRRGGASGRNWLDSIIEWQGLDPKSKALRGSWGQILDRLVAIRLESYSFAPLSPDFQRRARWCPGPGPRAAPFASFSRDGQLLAYRFGGKALLCRVRDGGLLFALEGQPLSFSPDSKKLATATRGVTRLWDVASGKPVFDLGGGDSFFPDGRTMYSGPSFWDTHVSAVGGCAGRVFVQRRTMDSGARLWDARTGREQGAINGYGGGGLAFSLDGKTLVSVSGAKATLWDVATAVKTDVAGKATVAPDGKSVAFEKGGSIKLHSSPSLSLPLSRKEIEKAGVDSDALWVKPGCFDDPQVPLPGSYPRRTVVSPDGKLQVELVNVKERSMNGGGGEGPPPGGGLDPLPSSGPLAIVERAKGEARRESGPEGKYRGVVAAAFSPDGRYLALGRVDGTILLWDISPAR